MKCLAQPQYTAAVGWAVALLLILPTGSMAGRSGQLDGEVMLEKGFDVKPGGMLDVNVPDAHVLLEPGSANRVEVIIYMDARNTEQGRKRYERMDIRAEATAGGVRIKSRSHRSWRWSLRDTGHFEVIVQIKLPEQFDADVSSSDGDIEVGRIRGVLDLLTSDGDIRVEDVEGEITCRTSDGDITVDKAKGPAELSTSDGDIRIGDLNGEHAYLATSDGDIDFDRLVCTEVHIRASDGSISGDEITAEEIGVETSDGEVDLTGVSGAVRATTSDGDLRIAFRSFAETRLRSGDGDIIIEVPSGTKADLELRANEVDLLRKLDFSGKVSDERASGTLNGGGPQLKATARDGRIALRTRDHD